MKQLLILILCAVLVLSMTACGRSTKPAPAPTTSATASPTAEPTQPLIPTEPEPETALVRNEHCAFTVTDTELNEHLGLQIHVLCENTSGRPLMFSWSSVSVCGFMYEPMWAEEVAPGKKVHSTVSIDTYALEQIGINEAEEVTFKLLIQDSEEFMNPPVVDQILTIYPTGKTAETAKISVRRQRWNTGANNTLIS